MRFEIKAGGAILILIGLAGLSLIVFALGLFAGYDMARNTAPEAPQAASVYPLPNPHASEEAQAPAPAKPPAQIASVPPKPQKVAVKLKPAAGSSAAASLPMDKPNKNVGSVAAAPHTIANAAPSASNKSELSDTSDDEDSDESSPPEKVASAPESSSGHHGKPFNIQIDAVMDRGGAEQMTSRLQKLGYHAFMVPTNISGQTWWRVRVGPYPSQDEASAAEQELRVKYKDAYAP
jgi:cell division septation protein DedD